MRDPREPVEADIEDTRRFLKGCMESETWKADPDGYASDMRATIAEVEVSNMPDWAKHYATFAVLEQTKKRRGKPTRSHRDDAIRRVAIKLIRRAASFAKHCAVSARSYRKNQSMPSWRKIPARSFIKHKVSPAFFEYLRENAPDLVHLFEGDPNAPDPVDWSGRPAVLKKSLD